jgi:hypothetical protein
MVMRYDEGAQVYLSLPIGLPDKQPIRVNNPDWIPTLRRPNQFILDVSAAPLEGLQSPSHDPEDGFGIVGIVPACPQVLNTVSL